MVSEMDAGKDVRQGNCQDSGYSSRQFYCWLNECWLDEIQPPRRSSCLVSGEGDSAHRRIIVGHSVRERQTITHGCSPRTGWLLGAGQMPLTQKVNSGLHRSRQRHHGISTAFLQLFYRHRCLPFHETGIIRKKKVLCLTLIVLF